MRDTANDIITDCSDIILTPSPITSALDSESEAIVQEALDVIMSKGDATVVVIAHRLSTIMNADMIAVVKEGKVAETGTHAKLLKKKGAYYELVEAQKGIKRSDSSASVATTVTDSSDNSLSRSNSDADFGGIEVETAPDKSTTTLDNNKAVIDVDNVHFTYPSRPDNKIFHGLGFEVSKGEKVAIVGPSGQGKSTIIQLIEEFYRPSKGKLRYNGDNIKKLNVRWYRDQ